MFGILLPNALIKCIGTFSGSDSLLGLTVRWHAVALRVVGVRCVRAGRLQGRTVLGLSVRGHDTRHRAPLTSDDLRRKEQEVSFHFGRLEGPTSTYLYFYCNTVENLAGINSWSLHLKY